LLIVQGILEGVMGVLYAVVGRSVAALVGVSRVASGEEGGMSPSDVAFDMRTTAYIAIGVMVVAAAVVRVVAGVRCLRYRSRTLAIVALAASAVPMFTCYCFPTALALSI